MTLRDSAGTYTVSAVQPPISNSPVPSTSPGSVAPPTASSTPPGSSSPTGDTGATIIPVQYARLTARAVFGDGPARIEGGGGGGTGQARGAAVDYLVTMPLGGVPLNERTTTGMLVTPTEIRIGGTIGWRYNNLGNLTWPPYPSTELREHPSNIGVGRGGFRIFATPTDGIDEVSRQLESRSRRRDRVARRC